MKRKFTPPQVCPVCGEDVPPRSVACPECGADERSGWKDDAHIYDGLDLPDDDFDHDEFVAREFGTRPCGGIHPLWLAVAIALLLATLFAIVRGG